MKTVAVRWAMLLLLAVLLMGCGGSEGNKEGGDVRNGEGGGGDVPLGEVRGGDEQDRQGLMESLLSAVCEKQDECCPGNESVQECLDSMGMALSPLFTLPYIEIDADAVTACAAKVAGYECSVAEGYKGKPPVLQVCEPFSTGMQADGGKCGGSGFLEGLFGDDQCASGNCVSGTCQPDGKLGDSCGDRKCEAGLACNMGKCAVPHAAGEDCSQDGLCPDGLDCYSKTPDDPMLCQEPTIIEVGEECATGTLCVLGESQCWCPVGEEGCLHGLCGNNSRCEK